MITKQITYLIKIDWLHIEDYGTCDSCTNTEQSIQTAIENLRGLFSENVELRYSEEIVPIEEIDKSNQIFIDGVPLETILNAEVVDTACEGCSCVTGSDTDCRSLKIEDIFYETVHTELIEKAIMRAITSKLYGATIVAPSSVKETKESSTCGYNSV